MGVTMTLFRSHVATPVPLASVLREISARRHFWLRWPGDVARGILWAGGDPRMTGCLESPLASPVLAQSWCQTATDGAWFSTTALLSGRD